MAKSKFSSKAAEKAARDAGLDPDSITGTGAGGNITKGDVLKAAEAPAADGEPAGSTGSTDPAADAAAPPPPPLPDPEEIPPPPVDGDKLPSKGKLEITRTNTQGDWWCPYCDHSQTAVQTACARCGAERDGDKVKAPRG